MKKTELLAPAGNYESFLGAIHAGADAVYLAGQKFGARAYAGNFSTEELCRAIRYAHLSERKVYLTLNTLIKEPEFFQIYEYLHPFYEEGLDGIIVQDLGVLTYIREQFPTLPLHISTQATVTGVEGARFLQNLGAVRVVPARELSLKEIRKIKEETGLELETFIHGAMCYCYSGQCLFSSIAGGRSGNRGRCAQPCRLPYELKIDGKHVLSKENYPLSLKDMCTIADLPKLLEAGIDSFKIEGRMKKPEYTAGVTSVYRKYIDRWYENPDKCRVIEPKDLNKLSSLYIRSEVQNGYYFKHNDADMITLESPAYSGSDEKLLQSIRNTYLVPEKKKSITAYVYCHAGEALLLTLYTAEGEECCVSLEGPIVETASKQPATEASIKDRICKMGNTFFEVTECQIDLGENCFVPVKILNELRREAVLRLEDAILKQKADKIKVNAGTKEKSSVQNIPQKNSINGFSVLVSDYDQLQAVLPWGRRISRLYIESELLISGDRDRILHIIDELKAQNEMPEFYIALPFVVRMRDKAYMEEVCRLLESGIYQGCLIRNVETLGFFASETAKIKNVSLNFDAGMYAFQKQTIALYKKYADTLTLPYELNRAEKKQLMQGSAFTGFEQVVYGRIPMMITANCLAKTTERCFAQKGGQNNAGQPEKQEKDCSKNMTLIDRYKHEFPVWAICEHCYNIIWNCIPLSLHAGLSDYEKCLKRIQFTTETKIETSEILEFFLSDSICGNDGTEGRNVQKTFPLKEYTTGHEKRGVE